MSFYNERTIKALRKPRQCQSCGRAMDIGESALYASGNYEGDFWTAHFHQECRAAEVVLNGQFGNGMDWYPLNEFDSEDREFIRESHPVAYGRVATLTSKGE